MLGSLVLHHPSPAAGAALGSLTSNHYLRLRALKINRHTGKKQAPLVTFGSQTHRLGTADLFPRQQVQYVPRRRRIVSKFQLFSQTTAPQ
ncbi:hypothetical protein Pyn_40115 [Prunus yedoensis var. nudiflora]|uniref:Uncharacterized protein n=1 Tax=Prunus yedoensis var. nudiflora TaxID=2094558 RepID=A0A314UJQ5_PRUYE|nr:hypothetical protein Pyn_40115 [Prunus yedoensis var. nudiflora]